MNQSRNQIQPPHRLVSVLILGGVLLNSLGCGRQSAEITPTSGVDVQVSGCLENLNLKQLNDALDRCDEVVKTHRSNPIPLVDRSLIYNLMNRPDEACRDVAKAAELLQQSQQKPDPMVMHELTVRQQSCKQRATMAGKD